MELREKKLDSTEIYSGKILKLYKDKVLCPNGHTSYREVVRHSKAVCVIAEKDGKFIIEEQYRYPYDEIILEFPAGKVDDNEDLVTAAIRELEEETGFYANSISYLGDIYPTCAYTDEIISLYYATSLVETKRHLDENEAINFSFISLDELKTKIINNEIKDAKTICAFQLFLLKKDIK